MKARFSIAGAILCISIAASSVIASTLARRSQYCFLPSASESQLGYAVRPHDIKNAIKCAAAPIFFHLLAVPFRDVARLWMQIDLNQCFPYCTSVKRAVDVRLREDFPDLHFNPDIGRCFGTRMSAFAGAAAPFPDCSRRERNASFPGSRAAVASLSFLRRGGA